MTLDPNDAALSLRDVDDVQRRMRESIVYAVSGLCLILWGVLTTCGYVYSHFNPQRALWAWIGIAVAGFAGTFLILYLRARRRGGGSRDWRLMQAQLVLAVFGVLCVQVLGPFTPRQLNAFWPLVVMLGFVLGGLWLGRFFILLGVTGAGLVVSGFLALGPWFTLWMAAVQGITLVLAGLWLRRIGTDP